MNLNFDKKYPSKILLFGEYILLEGANALSLPFGQCNSHWEKSKETDEPLLSFLKFLSESSFDQFPEVSIQRDKIKDAIDLGICFDSNIRTGYGLGSSGTLTAACFENFFKINQEIDIHYKKSILGFIESYFHGKSSGFDALTIYLNQTLIREGKNIKALDFSLAQLPGVFYLYDSREARKTSELVGHFVENILSDKQKKKSIENLIIDNDRAIEASINNKEEDLFKAFAQISLIQYNVFERMIHPNVKQIWEKGLNEKNYFMKLLGAGGGGYYLLYAKEPIKGLDESLMFRIN